MNEADRGVGLPPNWWSSLTVAELRRSADVIAEFTREGASPSSISIEQFARALALQVLLVEPDTIEKLIANAVERCEAYLPALGPGDDPVRQQLMDAWVGRCREITQGIEQCAALVESCPEGAVRAQATRMRQYWLAYQGVLIDFYVARRLDLTKLGERLRVIRRSEP